MSQRNPILWIGLTLVLIQAAAALAAPWLSAVDPNAQDILSRLQGPSADHWLGTDNFGRDIFARALAGERTLFAISGLSVLAALMLGGGLGVVCAWRGGWFDAVMMRLMDVLFGFPIILLAIGIIAVAGPGALGAAIAIATAYTPIFARILRGPTLLLKSADYVIAAQAIGATDWRIIRLHLLPNLAPVILVQTSLSLSTAILVEASLSFLGLGVQPPTASLGRMLAESRNFLSLSPWPAIFAGAVILLAALGFNLLGDGLQDRLNPRLRSRR
jgi:peptide/nickel transport system permease protein